MSEDELSSQELATVANVELLIQARDAVTTALEQALAGLPEAERARFEEQEVEGFSLARFAQPGLIQINVPAASSAVGAGRRGAWVTLNPQPLPPKAIGGDGLVISV